MTTTRLQDPAPPALAGRPGLTKRHVLSDDHDVTSAAIALAVERHGSLGVGHLRPILAEHGFGLVLGPHARQRLLQRRYDEAGAA